MELTDITIVVLKNEKLPFVKPGEKHVIPISTFNQWLENAGCQIAKPVKEKSTGEKADKKLPE